MLPTPSFPTRSNPIRPRAACVRPATGGRARGNARGGRFCRSAFPNAEDVGAGETAIHSSPTMHPTQTTLTASDNTDGPDSIDDTTAMNNGTSTSDEASTSASTTSAQTILAPPDQRGGERCCPWCLAAADTFEHYGDGRARCGHCDAAIPVGVDWFERGEKIAV